MKVHLSDIAKKVGVSKMTVSRALRDDPAVPPANRKRILAAAKELDYTPNPKLARLMSEMAQSRSHPNALGELAYITTEDTEFGWKQYYHQLSCYEGAKAEAKGYGYNLLPVWALSRRFTRGRLTEFLWSRGVDGLIVQPLGRAMIGRPLDIDWSKFCSVQIGATLPEPKLNLVRHNHYDGMMQTLLAMERLGYRRIGLCFSSDSDVRSYHRWASAYLYWRTVRGYTNRSLPSFHYLAGDVDTRAFKNWLAEHRIEGVVAMDSELMAACQKIGLKIPDDLGFSVLDHPGGGSTVAGIDQIGPQIGSMAVDILIMAVRKGAKGVPAHPIQTIVEGKWVPGETVRCLKPLTNVAAPHDLTDIQSSF
jgi:DNA-binding LacI/PurR family transcriptional regulator